MSELITGLTTPHGRDAFLLEVHEVMVKTAGLKDSKQRLMQRDERYMASSTMDVDAHSHSLRRIAAVPND
eukprot:7082531-Prymnesium_polylepis.1